MLSKIRQSGGVVNTYRYISKTQQTSIRLSGSISTTRSCSNSSISTTDLDEKTDYIDPNFKYDSYELKIRKKEKKITEYWKKRAQSERKRGETIIGAKPINNSGHKIQPIRSIKSSTILSKFDNDEYPIVDSVIVTRKRRTPRQTPRQTLGSEYKKSNRSNSTSSENPVPELILPKKSGKSKFKIKMSPRGKSKNLKVGVPKSSSLKNLLSRGK